MGKKYIIELEDKPFHKEDGDFLYRVKGFNSLVFDMTGVGKLTPYTEPDLEQVKKKAYDEGYQSGREDLNIVMSDVEQAKADAYLKGLNDGQGVILASTQNNAFNNGYKKCLKDIEQVSNEAYEDGYKTAKVQCNIQAEKDMREVGERHYQRGLNDAWDAAKKIALDKEDGGLDTVAYCEIFGYGKGFGTILKKFSASEAIEKIQQYEQKQEMDGLRQNIQTIVDQCGYTLDEISEVLEKMRGEQDE